MLAVLDRNELRPDDVISILFTATADLSSQAPALGARQVGLDDAALLCAQEMRVEGSMPRVIRLMAHVEVDLTRSPTAQRLPARHRDPARRDPAEDCGQDCGRRMPPATGESGRGRRRRGSARSAWSAPGCSGPAWGSGCASSGVRVLLSDPSPTALALARDVGAGELDGGDAEPALVVVASPPDVTAQVVQAELAAHPGATVTDVASVKSGVAAQVSAGGGDLTRYVGGHPLAGRERSGPVAARGDLFLGRPWVVCPTADSAPDRVEAVRGLAIALGATPVTMAADEHDEAVALVSHLPQVASSLVAARLRLAADPAVALAGQGLRDLTRIAGSDPMLWAQVLVRQRRPGGRGAARDAGRPGRRDRGARRARQGGPAPGRRGRIARPPEHPGPARCSARLVADGNIGRDRIPGKHGAPPTSYAVVTAHPAGPPGQLGRLFHDIAEAGINVEEFSLEHSPGQQVGLAEVSVLPAAREALEAALDPTGLARRRLTAPPAGRAWSGPWVGSR